MFEFWVKYFTAVYLSTVIDWSFVKICILLLGKNNKNKILTLLELIIGISYEKDLIIIYSYFTGPEDGGRDSGLRTSSSTSALLREDKQEPVVVRPYGATSSAPPVLPQHLPVTFTEGPGKVKVPHHHTSTFYLRLTSINNLFSFCLSGCSEDSYS